MARQGFKTVSVSQATYDQLMAIRAELGCRSVSETISKLCTKVPS